MATVAGGAADAGGARARPGPGAGGALEAGTGERAERLIAWVSTTDHKRIGILYLITTAAFFLLGGVEALVMRLQLSLPRATVVGPETYNWLFTMHGTTMIFLVVMPMLLGFANYLLPLMIGARDMAYPRLNALSFWLLLFGGLLLYFSFFSAAPPDFGWFAYAPLTERPYTMHPGVEYWILGLLVTSVGTIATGLNLIVTTVKLRCPGMSPRRIPVFVWMSLITGLLIVWAIPPLTAAQVMLLLDRALGAKFFVAQAGGDPLLWQHLFWFFGHPEVYIMVLPAFGMLSEVVPVFSRKPIFGYTVIVASGVFIAFYSMLVWAHHMFAVGMGQLAEGFFGATSMIIAIPTGIKIFSWLGTMWRGRLRLQTPLLFCLGFIAMFTIGGLSGVHFAIVPIDWQTTDTYYVVAHFHFVLFGGTFFGILAGLYYWFPKITGRLLDERVGRWHFWLTLAGFLITFFPMHFLGLMGMPRRVYTYPDLPGWGPINLVVTGGAFLLGLSVLLGLWNVWRSLRRGVPAGDNPWQGWTLEWATTSPPPAHNFRHIPVVDSARPLYGTPGGGAALAAEQTGEGHASAGVFDKTEVPVLGTLVFVTSELFFFGALIVTFIAYRTRSGAGPGPEVLDVPRMALFSLALWASSATLVFAERRLRRDDVRGGRLGLVATLALGAVFLIGEASEWMKLIGEGVTIDDNLFTSAFYTLTGFHGLHVLVGIVALAVLAVVASDLRPGRRGAMEAVATYWHFVDALWVVIFSVVYLWTLL